MICHPSVMQAKNLNAVTPHLLRGDSIQVRDGGIQARGDGIQWG